MFKYYNINPEHLRISDCVCRAISLATDTDYHDVMQLLQENADDNQCDCLKLECYSKMIDDIGYERHNAEGKTVQQISEENKDKTVIIRIEGHLTCSKNGDIYDIWDCTKKTADVYWIVD